MIFERVFTHREKKDESLKTSMIPVAALLLWAGLCTSVMSAADQYVVVVLDDSGSMNERMKGMRTGKMDIAKEALLSVLEDVPDDAEVGVLALNSRGSDGHWIVPLGPVDRSSLRRRISSMGADGGTPLGAAMKEAADALLAKRDKQVYGTYRLLIVTDGEAGDQALVEQYLPAIKARGLITDVIGVDMRGDHSLATKVNTYRRADNPASLKKAIADVFAETSDDAAGAGESDYDLLGGIPDEVAWAALASLTATKNQPIGEEETDQAAAESAADSGAAAQGRSGNNAPAQPPSADGLGLGGLCCSGFVVLFFIVVGMLILASSARRRRR
jgi:uncharacterized protein YegL